MTENTPLGRVRALTLTTAERDAGYAQLVRLAASGQSPPDAQDLLRTLNVARERFDGDVRGLQELRALDAQLTGLTDARKRLGDAEAALNRWYEETHRLELAAITNVVRQPFAGASEAELRKAASESVWKSRAERAAALAKARDEAAAAVKPLEHLSDRRRPLAVEFARFETL